jgi:hypothetical protein
MFCRMALIVLMFCCIVWPVQTVDTITHATLYAWEWLAAFNIEYAKEMSSKGIEIVNDRLQHREMH